MHEVADTVQDGLVAGRGAVIGRVIELKGFSTLPVDELIAIDSEGRQYGDLLGRPGALQLGPAAAEMLAAGAGSLRTVAVEIHGADVAELGLACGGRAEVLLQPAAVIPNELWARLANRAPVALVTYIEGPAAGPAALVVDRSGQVFGSLPDGPDADEYQTALDQARSLLAAGHSGRQRVETRSGVALIEAWVPGPRLVVVGTGEVVGAIEAQGALLGWETRATEDLSELTDLFDWAGATAALIVLSHDPHVDAPALAAGLDRKVPYVGAMGSRGTQSRRLDRLAAQGVAQSDLDRIHRPIGLNLGGRRAAEVALAIVAEIQAGHYGRDGGALRDHSGPIHG